MSLCVCVCVCVCVCTLAVGERGPNQRQMFLIGDSWHVSMYCV